jgi:hypothetical protein
MCLLVVTNALAYYSKEEFFVKIGAQEILFQRHFLKSKQINFFICHQFLNILAEIYIFGK